MGPPVPQRLEQVLILVARAFAAVAKKADTDFASAGIDLDVAFKCYKAHHEFYMNLTNEHKKLQNYFETNVPSPLEGVPWGLKQGFVNVFRLHMPILARDACKPRPMLHLTFSLLIGRISWVLMLRRITLLLGNLARMIDISHLKLIAARCHQTACRNQLFEARSLLHSVGVAVSSLKALRQRL